MRYLDLKAHILNLRNVVRTALYWNQKDRSFNSRVNRKLAVSKEWSEIYNELYEYRKFHLPKDTDPLFQIMRDLSDKIGMMR